MSFEGIAITLAQGIVIGLLLQVVGRLLQFLLVPALMTVAKRSAAAGNRESEEALKILRDWWSEQQQRRGLAKWL